MTLTRSVSFCPHVSSLFLSALAAGLTLMFSLATGMDPWLLHAVVLGAGLLWLFCFVRYLPQYIQRSNRVWSAFGAVFTWAALCSVLAKLLNNPEAGVAGYVFLIGAPCAGFGGYALAFLRYSNLANATAHLRQVLEAAASEQQEQTQLALRGDKSGSSPASGASAGASQLYALSVSGSLFGMAHTPATPYDVEMRVRYLLAGFMAQARESIAGHAGTVHVQQPQANKHGGASGPHSRRGSKSVAGAGGGPGAGRRGSTTSLAASETAASHGHGNGETAAAEDTGGDGEEDLPLVIRLCAAMYAEAATSIFPSSGLLAALRANFMRCFIGDAEAELAVIHEGLAKDAAIDVRFLLLQAKRQLEEGTAASGSVRAAVSGQGGHGHGHGHGQDHSAHGGHGGHSHGGHGSPHREGKMSIIERVQHEQWMGEAQEASLRARRLEQEFWAALRAAEPDMGALSRCSEGMSAAIAAASAAFAKLLATRPHSVEVLQVSETKCFGNSRQRSKRDRRSNSVCKRVDIITLIVSSHRSSARRSRATRSSCYPFALRYPSTLQS